METGVSLVSIIFLCSGFIIAESAEDCPNLSISSEWGEGWDGSIVFNIDHSTNGGWVAHLTFDIPITDLECWMATVSSTDKKTFTLTNRDSNFQAGAHVELHVLPRYTSRPRLIAADFDGQDICGFPQTTTSNPTTQKTTASPNPGSTTPHSSDCSDAIDILSDDGTTTSVDVKITPTVDINSWTVVLNFDADISGLTTPMADVSGSGKQWTLSSKSWDGSILAGQTFLLNFYVYHAGNGMPGFVDVSLNGDSICSSAMTTTSSQNTGTTTAHSTDCTDVVDILSNDGTTTSVDIKITPTEDINSWTVVITFDSEISGLTTPMADVSGSRKQWTLSSKSWDGSIQAGQTFLLNFYVYHAGNGMPGVFCGIL